MFDIFLLNVVSISNLVWMPYKFYIPFPHTFRRKNFLNLSFGENFMRDRARIPSISSFASQYYHLGKRVENFTTAFKEGLKYA